jgi:hypothetical protein
MAVMEFIKENECLIADGLDDAIIGVTAGINPQSMCVVYDYHKCVDIFIQQGMSWVEAIDWMEFNVVNAYVGENTPVFVHTQFHDVTLQVVNDG